MEQKIKAGDAVIIRYEGPKGGPGMREMQMFRSLLKFAGLLDKVYLITDGRFSGYTGGPCVGYLSPEAAEGGPLAVLRDGDIIRVDIEKRRLDAELSDDELRARLEKWTPPPPRIKKGYLVRYSAAASSAARGAILE
jgi:dihydroxy-acid dehydratase